MEAVVERRGIKTHPDGTERAQPFSGVLGETSSLWETYIGVTEIQKSCLFYFAKGHSSF